MDILLLVIAVICVAALILNCLALIDILYVRKINDMHRGVDLELKRRLDLYESTAKCAEMSAEFFAMILIDLANTNYHEAIDWKLYKIRNVQMVMESSGWHNRNLYQWMRENLSEAPPDDKMRWIDSIEEAVRGYYVMDVSKGKNICDVLRLLGELTTQRDAIAKDNSGINGNLVKIIDSLNLSFAVCEDEHEVKAAGTVMPETFGDLLSALSITSDTLDEAPGRKVPAPAVSKSIIIEGGTNVVRKTEAGSTEEVRCDMESPELQGQEREKESDGQGPVFEPVPQRTPKVVVVDRTPSSSVVEYTDEET